MPSSSKKPLVFVTRRLPDQIQARMMELFDTRLNDSDTPLSQGEMIEAVQSANVFVPTVTDSINREIIAAAGEQLRLIASFGTGVDHVDLAAAKERDILVTNTPGVLTEDTADMAMALILAAPRRLTEGDRLVRGGPRAAFDQQPIEAAALIAACKAAYRVSGDRYWLDEMRRCLEWYLGKNDVGVPMIDFKTRGCFDGLKRTGVNQNQGAESLLSWLLSLAIMHEMQTGDAPEVAKTTACFSLQSSLPPSR